MYSANFYMIQYIYLQIFCRIWDKCKTIKCINEKHFNVAKNKMLKDMAKVPDSFNVNFTFAKKMN